MDRWQDIDFSDIDPEVMDEDVWFTTVMTRLDEVEVATAKEIIPILTVPADTSDAIQLLPDNQADYERLRL